MKILTISASPRKESGNTFGLLEEVLSILPEEGFRVENIHLCDLKIEFCRDCEVCHKKILLCPIKDDAHLLIEKMIESKGIIFSSPVYINHITGYLKTFLDRTSHFIHCQRLLGKYIAAVATSGGGSHEMVPEYIKHYALICGAQYVGGVSTTVPVTEEVKVKARNLGKDFVAAITMRKEFSDQMMAIRDWREYFKKIIVGRKDEWPGEYQYWEERGWL